MDRLVIMLVPITFFVCAAAVLVLRPLSGRLGELLVELKKDRVPVPGSSAELHRLAGAVDELSAKVDQLEKKNEFLERLLENKPAQSLPIS